MSPTTDRHTVLFVDDEPKARKYFERAFGNDFGVLTAAGSAEAETLLESRAGEVAVLLTDQRMPAGDGVSLLSRTRQRHPHIVRLLTTAYTDVDEAIAAVNRGEVWRYITKPWDLTALRAVLHEAFTRQRQQQHEQALLHERRRSTLSVAGHIAHEMRTPLAAVRSASNGIERYLPQLLEAYRLAAEAGLPVAPIRERQLAALDEAVSGIRRVTERAGSVIDLLLANCGGARIAAGSFEPCSAAGCVTTALEDYPFQPGERERVHWAGGPDFGFQGSASLMVFVLHNLLRNALRAVAIAGSGAVEIRTEADQRRRLIAVEDTGTGIAPQVLPHIFEDFASFADGNGVGIGLGFCARVMEGFGGHIRCDSELGRYTRFELIFPAAEPGPEQGKPETVAP